MNTVAYLHNRVLKITSLLLLALAILSLFGTRQAAAQTTAASPSAAPTAVPDNNVVYRTITELPFPIDDLGDCTTFNSCNTYCQDPVNYNTCAEFAKEHGFYEPDPVQAPTPEFWTDTKDALGCDSEASCMAVCLEEANYDKCDAFAKSKKITGGGYVGEPDNPELLEKAKAALGCDSTESCGNFCDNTANAQKCAAFANQEGLIGGEVKEGPGGCSSEDTCNNFCSDPSNLEVCRPFSPPNQEYHGPGGCTDPQGCRSFCETNPDSCRSYAPGSNGRYVPVNCPAGQYFGPGGACTANEKTQEAAQCSQGGKYWSGSSCQDQAPPGIHTTIGNAFFQARPDMGGCKTPGECYDFCKENAGKCGGFNAEGSRPPDTYLPTLYYTPGTTVKHEPVKEMGGCTTPGGCYDFCKENPSKCQGFDAKAPRPVDTLAPGTYYTPPTNFAYVTPPTTNFYVTPVYYTPPAGSNYTTPKYYTPGQYFTPSYYTPPTGSNYTTPSYYTPGTTYYTPANGATPPPYTTPTYYSPPAGSNYTTPTYYSPPAYVTPNYYTPPTGSNYTTPNYVSPASYITPSYYTPPAGSNYTTPTYSTPGQYYSPTAYPTPSYSTPGSGYTTPSYPTPGSYSYPTPGSYSYPTPGSYSYPTPSYVYPSPSGSGTNYYTPNSSYTYPSPTDGYSTPSSSNPYPAPPGYGTPSYGTPAEYPTPSYSTPSYSTPSYGTPAEYPTPPVQGASTELNVFQKILLRFFN